MQRQGSRSLRRRAVLGALLTASRWCRASLRPTRLPGHIRGIVTAKTKAGRALADKLADRGLGAGGLLGSGSNNLQYNGGPVMHSDANYAIYWEPSGYSTPSAYKSIVNGYFGNVAAASGATTNNYSVATQYYDGSGNIAYSATAPGSIVDTNPYPSSGCISTSGGPCISDSQLQTEVNRVVAANGWPKGLGAMYFVYFPPNVTTCTDIDQHRVLRHGVLRVPQLAGLRLLDDSCTRTCPTTGSRAASSGESPNGDAAADDELNVTSHENIEAITDPLGTAWYDSSGQEIGDKCNFTFGSPLGGAAGRSTTNRSPAATTGSRRNGATPPRGACSAHNQSVA